MIASLRRRAAARTSRRDDGYTLIELLIVVVIIGVMSAVAVGSFGGMVQGMNNTMVQSSLQATRVALAASTVSAGTVPQDASGQPAALTSSTVMFPANDSRFQVGYVPFCFQILDGAGVATNTWLHNGTCTAADREPASVGGPKPLLEIDFVLCARYGSTGALYVADTWHSVAAAQSGQWPDGTAIQLHGCTPVPITGGSVPPQA